MRYLYIGWLLVGLLGTASPTQGQNDRVSEAEMRLQEKLIEAGKAKILEDIETAVEAYENILKDHPDNATAAFELARLLAQQEFYVDARRWAKKAVVADPENVWSQKLLADLYQETGDFTAAANIYRGLKEKAPGETDYYYKEAYMWVKAGDLDRALKVYDELEAKAGISEALIRRKHSLYMGTGDYKKAEGELRRLIEAFPQELDYRYRLAGFYKQVGKAQKALEVYEAILAIDPYEEKARMELAGNSFKASDEEAYLTALKPVFEDGSVDIDLKIGKILPFIQRVAETGQRNLADATLELTDILESVHPNEAKPLAASGDLFYHTDRLEAAAQKYKSALQRDESVYVVWEQLLYTQRALGRYEAVLETAGNAMDVFPNQGALYMLYASAANALADYGEALDWLDQALLMSGKDQNLKLDILIEKGIALAGEGDSDAAYTAFEEALRIYPKSPQALGLYSLYLAIANEAESRYRDLLKAAQKATPELPGLQHAAAWAAFRSGDPGGAQTLLQKAETAAVHPPRRLEQFGDLYFLLGEEDRALEMWNNALNAGSQSTTLTKKIADKKYTE